MGFTPFGAVPPLQLQATTGPNGFALANGTPTILSWTAPNDGQMHRYTVFAVLHVAALETGGAVSVTYTAPFAGATLHTGQLYAAGLASDTSGQGPSNTFTNTVAPGTTVNVVQSSALTAGGPSTLFAEIWGS